MTAAYTKGPWITFGNGHCIGGPIDPADNASGTAGIAMCSMSLRSPEENAANAKLIAACPAMDLALKLIACGAARLEASAGGRLVEFCVGGFRFSFDGDWNRLFDVLGWDEMRAALAAGSTR